MEEPTVCVVIPAYNEESTINQVITAIPRKINGVKDVKVIVVNDGSQDRTEQEAKNGKADIVYSFRKNRGLAPTFNRGIELAIENAADIVVTIDADMQYEPKEIPEVIKPILEGKADVVLTDRRVMTLKHMPLKKRIGNVLATQVLRHASSYPVQDGQSGFRAFTREAARMINIQSNYTYVAESIIQLTNRGYKIVQVPCTFNSRMDRSRLIRNIWNYAYRAGLTITRTYLGYRALRIFILPGILLMCVGFFLAGRFLLFYFEGMGQGHIQSLILATIMLVMGFQVVILGLVADLINSNRRLMEDVLFRLKK